MCTTSHEANVRSFTFDYIQSLKLSNSALGQTTTGHVVNLMSNDVVRFDYVSDRFSSCVVV